MQAFRHCPTPGGQLPLEELPRGIVPFPQPALDAVEYLQQKIGKRFTDEQRRQSLELHTLAWFYEGNLVAYRSAPGAIEVLGVGYDEAAPYRHLDNGDVRVVKP